LLLITMPPKRKGRTSRAKPKKVALTPEEQETRDQVDLFLKDYDKNREQTVKDAWRDVDSISASINTMYKLELMKLPQEVKNMKWDDFYQQALDKGQNPLALSEAISACFDDSICATVDTEVSKIKSAIKSTAKSRKGRNIANAENNPPPSATRSSSRNKTSRSSSKNSKNPSDSSNTETPANTRKGRSAKNEVTTPANTRAPPNKGRTPMITPKFDTSQALSRTVSRVARKDEVLVSLSGSPVVGVTARTTKAEEEQAVLVPVGKGETLCVPIGEDMDTRVDHLDQDQLDRLQELQQSLAIMLKSRREEES